MQLTRKQLRKLIMEAVEEGSYGGEGKYAAILDEDGEAIDEENKIPSLKTDEKSRYAYLDKHGSTEWKSGAISSYLDALSSITRG